MRLKRSDDERTNGSLDDDFEDSNSENCACATPVSYRRRRQKYDEDCFPYRRRDVTYYLLIIFNLSKLY